MSTQDESILDVNEEDLFVSIRVHSRLRNFSLAAPPQTRATKKGSPRISNHESTLMHTNEEWLFVSIRVHSRLRNLSLAASPQTRATKKGSPRISNHESTLMHTNEDNLFVSIRVHSRLKIFAYLCLLRFLLFKIRPISTAIAPSVP